MAKAQKNAQQVSQKWSRNLSGATQSITDGVNAVTQAPGVAAAAQQQAMLAKLTAAVQSGKWAARVSAVGLNDWKTAMTTKGIQRVASGAQAAEPKMAKFLTDFLPVAAQVSQEVSAMPKVTIEDSVNRSATAIRRFAAWGASRK